MPSDAGQTPPSVDPVKLPGRRPLGGLLNLSLVVLAIAVATALALLLLGGRDEVTVPELVGLNVRTAVAKAEATDLTLATEDGVPLTSGGGDPGAAQPGGDALFVISQDPAAGAAAAPGSTIVVDVAVRAQDVIVPGVVGLTLEAARASLEAVGLEPGELRVDEATGTDPGTITRQSPGAGVSTTCGRSVDLWIASAANVDVPDVAGLTVAQAETAAGAAGMTLEILSEITDEVLPGLVFRQSPRAGSKAAPGSQLVVVVNGTGRSSPGDSTAGGGPATDDGTVDDSAAGSTGAAVPPAFAALAAAFPFPVLYPAPPPPELTLESAADNPRRLTDQEGESAFEIRYVELGRPTVRLLLLQGGHFELGTDEATTVDVRGFPASLGNADRSIVLSWQENGIPYLIVADGLEEADVVDFAGRLQPVPRP